MKLRLQKLEIGVIYKWYDGTMFAGYERRIDQKTTTFRSPYARWVAPERIGTLKETKNFSYIKLNRFEQIIIK